MPSPERHRKDQEKNIKKGRLLEKASSFHGRAAGPVAEMLPRPRTVPNLLSGRRFGGTAAEELATGRTPPRLTKLLLHVIVLRSPGALHVLMPPEGTVEDLIAAAMHEYAKEARRPVFRSADASGFNLHYSQFSLHRVHSVTDHPVPLTGLDRGHKLMELGSRNFFLCPRNASTTATESHVAAVMDCSKEVDMKGLTWVKFMGLLI